VDVPDAGSLLCRMVTLGCIPGRTGKALAPLLEPGLGGGGIVVGRSRENSDGLTDVLAPSEERLTRFEVAGPFDRFRAGSPAEGTGKKVGVAGRDEGVGMELVVAELPAESLEIDRRVPLGMVL
jgi:hypothetical protein